VTRPLYQPCRSMMDSFDVSVSIRAISMFNGLDERQSTRLLGYSLLFCMPWEDMNHGWMDG
jgi:hypothetical protein